MKDLIFGVVGNMGPEADILFQDIIFKEEVAHGAVKDQDHMGMVVIKNPDIPDRSEAINEGGSDPIPEMLESVKFLERNQVHFAVMTCNTAHYFRNDLQAQTDVYLLDMLKATTHKIQQENPQATVGILCTNGTYNSAIYDKYLEEAQIAFFKPTVEIQERYVHSAIYGAKTGEKTQCGQDIRTPFGIKSGEFVNNAKLLCKAIETLTEQGADTIILGCTELPLVRSILEAEFIDVEFIDPMETVAEKVVEVYEAAKHLYFNTQSIAEIEQVNLVEIHSVDDVAHYIVSKAKAHQLYINS
ncbi:amino acid racemase [uncultured Shewanella sp.]|uniref:aspartate/glutamate racemase family protein n=1 Tax=uncultured Shewanella sp. TaxID=173975 RepID=UPI0026361B73|nr:amino acid racemase [uncultured Shewanella sp.]